MVTGPVALAESQEIGAMLPFLRMCPPQALVSRLKTVLAGPELPSEEDQASNQARNIQFELWFANTLWRGIRTLHSSDIRFSLGRP
jgi:hypothetical protein